MKAPPLVNKPPATAGEDCPLWRRDVSKVCHKCPWYVQVRGKDPQSEQEIDWFACAIGWMPTLLIDNTQQSRQSGAAIESFRNEIVKSQPLIAAGLAQVAKAISQNTQALLLDVDDGK